MRTLDDAPMLDMFSPDFQADPGPTIEELRAQSWVVRTPIGGLVIGRDEVSALLADRRLRSSIPDLVRLQGVEGELYDALASSIIALEGDDHTRLRKLVSRSFTPRAVDVHREDMRTTLSRLLEPVVAAGRCDFVADIADHYPIEVMCHLLGVPAEDHADFATWNRALTWALSFDLSSHRDDVLWGMTMMFEYVAKLMEARRAAPADDLVTALVFAHEDDDRLTDAEVLSMIGALLFAGYDTTRNQLGLGMWLFTQYPEQWDLLCKDPSLAGKAVEEMMRYSGTVGAAPRTVVEDFEMGGYRFTAGTVLTLSTSAANHDPAVYGEDTFDITADREPHFTFGGGPHYCLGASLARAEMQEALPLLAEAMPALALGGEPTWRPRLGIFGPEHLPLRFGR